MTIDVESRNVLVRNAILFQFIVIIFKLPQTDILTENMNM